MSGVGLLGRKNASSKSATQNDAEMNYFLADSIRREQENAMVKQTDTPDFASSECF